MTAKTGAERQAEYRERARREHDLGRLSIMVPKTTLILLDRISRHRNETKMSVIAKLIDAAARQLPANERNVIR